MAPTIRLGTPIMAGMVSHMLMGLVDTVMVGQLGVTPLAAASFVLLLLQPPVTFGLGLLSAVAVLSAQALGANRPAQAGEALRNGLLAAIGTGLAVGLAGHALVPFLGNFGQAPEVAAASREYLLIIGWSVLPALVAHACKQFCEARRKAWAPNALLLGSVALNAGLNWILIFGHWGAPPLGLEGAGWATLLARLIVAVAILVYVLAGPDFQEMLPARWLGRINVLEFKEMLRVGAPAGIQQLLEVGAFAFAALMMGWISAEALAAHQIAINCAATTFMFVLGLGMATSIRVGHAWGAGRPRRVRRIGFTGMALAAAIMAGFGLILFAARYPISQAFVASPPVIAIAAQLFIVAALFQIADGLQVTAIFALRGLSDTHVPAVIGALAYWLLAIPLAYALGFWTPLGPTGIWIGLALGLGVVAALMTWRFHRLTAGKIPPAARS